MKQEFDFIELAGTLYTPATSKHILNIANGKKFDKLKSINENRPIIVIQRNINDISSSRYKLLAKSIDAITTIELINKPV